MKDATRGYIFRCSNTTEKECFRRLLLGETESFETIVKKIRNGDYLFLFNVSTEKLHGPFFATSSGAKNLVKDAWGGKFPWQVTMEQRQTFEPLSRGDIGKVIPFKKSFNHVYPQAEIYNEHVQALLKLFERKKLTPSEEDLFRENNPAIHPTEDGHIVRSRGEVAIDNWLYSHGICHAYEKRLSAGSRALCDFYIPSQKETSEFYIELWGLEEKNYLLRKKRKQEFYKRNNLPLLQLTLKDVVKLDGVIPEFIKSLRRK